MPTTVTTTSGMIGYGQKTGQTNFSPGKTNGRPLDQNWPKDFLQYTGNPVADALINVNKFVMVRVANFKTLTVCAPSIRAPIAAGAPVSIDGNILVLPALVDGTYAYQPMTTQDNDGSLEKNVGSNGFTA